MTNPAASARRRAPREVALHAKRQERDAHREFIHRLEAIGDHAVHGRALGERLGVETRHRHRGDRDSRGARGVGKLPGHHRVAELVVEGLTLPERSQVDLDPVGSDFAREGKGADFLALEDHPVAYGDPVAGRGECLARVERRRDRG